MNRATPLSVLLARRARLIAQQPPWTALFRGSLMRYATRCGYRGCRCHTAKQFRHGPYWYFVIHHGPGRQRPYAIVAAKVPAVRAGRRAYDRLWRGLVQIAELNFRILKAQGPR